MHWLNLRKTLFLDLLLFILHESTDAQGQAPQCPVFKVQRGVVHKVFRSNLLKISCKLQYCDGQTTNVFWTKEDNNVWIPVSGADHVISSTTETSSSYPKILISYLTITNISVQHDGLYRCELKSSNYSMVSHQMNVSVSAKDNGDSSRETPPWWQQKYLFICLVVVILFIVVMLISILCINGCKSSRKQDTQRAHIKYTTASVIPPLSPSRQMSSVQCSLETWHKNSLRSAPIQSSSHPSSECGGDDSQSNRRDSNLSQVVYASLHHLTSSPSSLSSPQQITEECSEYAAIRLS